jgi:hypothetical protein
MAVKENSVHGMENRNSGESAEERSRGDETTVYEGNAS